MKGLKYFSVVILIMVSCLLLEGCSVLDKRAVVEKKAVEKREIAAVFGNSQSRSIPFFSFARIPAVKRFMMGSPSNERYRDTDENGADRKPVPVEISKAFMMMTTEVTQKQYFQVTGKNPSKFNRSRDCANYDAKKKICPDNPVEKVTWDEVQEFIRTLNKLQGLKGCKGRPQDPKGCYRLPTEAEWEWAVRAGTKTAYFFGNDASQLRRYAVFWKFGGISDRTLQVKGGRLPNRNGLYDVYGNVSEWVQDSYKAWLPGGKDPLVATGSSLQSRVYRGGNWAYPAKFSRSASRDGMLPFFKNKLTGFRLVRTL